MKKIKTKIKDLFLLQGKTFFDNRGSLRETFRLKDINKKIIFSIVSISKKNVLRGLHLQTKNSQDKLISVLKGKILDVAVDLRKNSKTFGKHQKVILSAKNCKSFFIPRGFAHGFLSLDKETIVLYGCSNYRHKSSEISINWSDKDLGVNWGIKKPIVSKKDKHATSFENVKKKLKIMKN